MIALQHERFGEPVEVVAAVEMPVPQPGAGEVRLRLVRSPIHNHDLATIRGRYGIKPELPSIPGTEMLGIVDALGEGVTQLQTGQRVAGMVRGSWAEYSIAPAASLIPLPDAIGDDAGAQLLAMPLSAVVLYDSLGAKPGEWIVQNAANGAVGRILVRLAQGAGVGIVSLVRRDDAAADLHSHGAKHVVVTAAEDWPNRVRDIAGSEPVVRVVDSVCDAQSAALNRLLAPGGEHVVFGALAGRALALDPGALIFGQTVVRGFWMTSWMKSASEEDRRKATMRVFELAMRGELPLPVAGIRKLSDGLAALREAEQPGRPGKVMLAP